MQFDGIVFFVLDITVGYFFARWKLVPAKAADVLIRKLAGASKRDMNPIERWVQTNPHLEEKLETEYQTGMNELKNAGMDSKVLSILQKAWTTSAERRLYVLTAMTALKQIAAKC